MLFCDRMDVTMNDLPTDAFADVFSYLSLHELLISEQVCKKWHRVALWYWQSIKRVTLAELMNVKATPNCEMPYYAQKFTKITESSLCALAKRCGDKLRHLETGCSMKMDVNCLNTLAAEFPLLQHLDLSKVILLLSEDDDEFTEFRMGSTFDELHTVRLDACLDDSASAYHSSDTADAMLYKVFSAMPNVESASLAQNTLLNGSCLLGLSTSLKSLDLGFCRRVAAETLTLVFSSLPNLRQISLYSNSGLLGGCLLYLPEDLESIDLSYCDSLDGDSLVHFFSTHTKLKTVHIAHTRGLTNRILNSMAESLGALDTLNLSWYLRATYYEGHVHPHDIVKGIKMIGAMKSLKQLDLSRNDFVLDASLVTISYGCHKLEDLNVSQLANVTQLGFSSLGRLNNLRKLDISDNNCVDESVLLSVAQGGKLESVNARKCRKVGEATIRRLGQVWPNKTTVFQVF